MPDPGTPAASPQVGVLVNGHLVSLSADAVVVTTASGSVVMHVGFDEITSVMRGGPDIVIVRGDHDPMSITFRRTEVATAFAQALHGLLSHRAQETATQRVWWRFWDR